MRCELVKNISLHDDNYHIPDEAYCQNEAVGMLDYYHKAFFYSDYPHSLCEDCLRKMQNHAIRINNPARVVYFDEIRGLK